MMMCEGWIRCIEWRDQLSCEKSRIIYLNVILNVYEKRWCGVTYANDWFRCGDTSRYSSSSEGTYLRLDHLTGTRSYPKIIRDYQ
jgi:hypothetical protein